MATRVFSKFLGGNRLINGDKLNNIFTANEAIAVARTYADALTAHAGGGQASALVLTAQVNRVTTVGTAADSVKLPASAAGRTVQVVNSSANSMQVFGTSPDTINGAATGTGVAVAAGKTAQFTCYTAGAWIGPVALA